MTARDRMVIAVVALIVAVVGVWFFVITPKRDQAAKLKRMGQFALDDDVPYETFLSLSYEARPLKRVLFTSEKQRRLWEPVTHFYAYDEVYPTRGQRGIAIVSTFRVDQSKTGELTLVISPDPEKTTGNYARIAGQFVFWDSAS